jgi:hypothetical protein
MGKVSIYLVQMPSGLAAAAIMPYYNTLYVSQVLQRIANRVKHIYKTNKARPGTRTKLIAILLLTSGHSATCSSKLKLSVRPLAKLSGPFSSRSSPLARLSPFKTMNTLALQPEPL